MLGSEEKTNKSAQSHGLQCIEDQPGGAKVEVSIFPRISHEKSSNTQFEDIVKSPDVYRSYNML